MEMMEVVCSFVSWMEAVAASERTTKNNKGRSVEVESHKVLTLNFPRRCYYCCCCGKDRLRFVVTFVVGKVTPLRPPPSAAVSVVQYSME